MRAAICEDEKIYADKLCDGLKQYLSEIGEKATIDLFTDGNHLSEKMKNGESYNVIFLDIRLENSDGMNTAEIIRQLDKNVPIIFVTGLEDRAADGYAVSAFDYIVKSDFERKFNNVMKRLMKTFAQIPLSIEDSRGNFEIVPLTEIMYIESEGRGTVIHTRNGSISAKMPIGRLSAELPESLFTEIYKSIYVNISEIKRTMNDTLMLSDGKILPLSRRRKKAVLSAIMENVRSGL